MRILLAVLLLTWGCSDGALSSAEPRQPQLPADPADPPDPDDPRDPDDPPPVDPPDDIPPRELPAFEPAPATMYRLTQQQYQNCVHDLLGPVTVPEDLEPDTPLHGFNSIGAAELTVSPRAAEQFEAAAYDVAEQAFATDPMALVGCDAAAAECLRGFLVRFGRQAWRRPLEAAEVDALISLHAELDGNLRDPWKSLEFVVASVLQSPWFLFRVERGADGRYTAWEMASRLSFLLWNSAPDEALLNAAATGGMDGPEGIRAQAERLIADPRAREALRIFFGEFFLLDRLDTLNKDRALFPQMSPSLGASMRGEVEAVLEDLVFERDVDIRELLTTQRTFLNAELASLYGLAPVDGAGLQPVRIPNDNPRGGLMGMGGILALNAHATVTSPTFRGKFIQNTLLCFDIPPPPPGVAGELEESPDGPTTTREKLARHANDPLCNGCHQYMDPLGLALENFDAIGAFRTTEYGLPIDARAEMQGEVFEGPRELGRLLRHREAIGACFARRFWRHAMGHLESDAEERAIRDLVTAFAADDHRFKTLLLAFVSSEAFRTVGEAE